MRRIIAAGLERIWHVQPRSLQPYATHIPVLATLCLILRPRVVVELGSGDYSTKFFLDRKCCPSLERLISLENDVNWSERVLDPIRDPRLEAHVFDGPMCGALGCLNREQPDLVFIDDSVGRWERARTVSAYLSRQGLTGVVVIHDCELWRIRLAARKLKYKFVFDALTPQTLVGTFKEGTLPLVELARINGEIKRRSYQVESNVGWVQLVHSLLRE